METLALVLVLIVGLQHCGFLVLEMFLWERPVGRKIFRTDPEFAKKSKSLAMNQGLYNGFLAAGLFWAFLAGEGMGRPLALFFNGCVVIAGLFGAATVSRRILWVQALPAACAFVASWMSLPM